MNEVWLSTDEEPGHAMFELVTLPSLLEAVGTVLGTRELSFHRGLCRPKLPRREEAAFPYHQASPALLAAVSRSAFLI